ncbi:MAG: hypothetical protein ACYDB2_09570 [Acidimicrobiales bacterium]
MIIGRSKTLGKERNIGMPTSKKDASKASEQLRSSKSTAAQKSVAGSDLAQAKKKPKKKG